MRTKCTAANSRTLPRIRVENIWIGIFPLTLLRVKMGVLRLKGRVE